MIVVKQQNLPSKATLLASLHQSKTFRLFDRRPFRGPDTGPKAGFSALMAFWGPSQHRPHTARAFRLVKISENCLCVSNGIMRGVLWLRLYLAAILRNAGTEISTAIYLNYHREGGRELPQWIYVAYGSWFFSRCRVSNLIATSWESMEYSFSLQLLHSFWDLT